ncbi:ATP-binding protein [Amycolatopsis sp. PS_44_ISF1]|uniref:ATP-binding protein n=1 Tax=Amycolatopsis sp. PS_44_ISF1 TaxID=2974917 RepID=UPI0028DE76A9|nr:ATP-binding protein [Amycolatopsis sp. PS_44_ISF1]MDT8912999.1 ATP-binding protein [Amycolatopsis sp. PS_44_ISF1]
MTSDDPIDPASPHRRVLARCSLVPPDGPDGLRQARAWMRRTVHRLVPGAGLSWICDVVMVLDELVSNALLHGRGCRGVLVTLDDWCLVVQVTDATTTPARLLDTATRAVSGLRLIERASTRWGQSATAGGKTVWAEVPRPRTAVPVARPI